MTAEVAVMNKQAIALAADSAVTFQEETGQKIFTSASKIFTLSKYEPVGVMIYGSATLMEIPWETIIKVYKRNLGQKAFKTVSDYAKNFLSFIVENEQLFPHDAQNRYVKVSIYSYFRFIADEITKKVEDIIEKTGEICDTSIKELTSCVVEQHFEKWKDTELISSVPEDLMAVLKQEYGEFICEAKKEVFEKLLLTEQSSCQLTEIALNLFIKFPTGLLTSDTSGIVIAGFGTEDIFPVLESFSIEGKIGNYLKYKKNEDECTEISFQNRAAIIPFAQSEMVSTFMTGIHPDYRNDIDSDIEQICVSYPKVLLEHIDCLDEKEKETLKSRLKKVGQTVFNEHQEKMADYRTKHHINPVMSVVQGLPKDELATMAETLISLTSFKRRVSMGAETVGGPIDVAVISKGDGFIWIKRKHYFQPELNPQFIANYYKEDKANGAKTIEEAG